MLLKKPLSVQIVRLDPYFVFWKMLMCSLHIMQQFVTDSCLE